MPLLHWYVLVDVTLNVHRLESLTALMIQTNWNMQDPYEVLAVFALVMAKLHLML